MNEFHVMFLTREQQVVIRLLMFDLLAKHIRLNIDRVTVGAVEYVQGQNSVPVDEQADSAYRASISAVDYYERITEALPTASTMPNSKDFTWQVGKSSMPHVLSAVNLYDPANTCLAPQEQHLVQKLYSGIKSLVNQSAQFVYTDADVRKVRKK